MSTSIAKFGGAFYERFERIPGSGYSDPGSAR